MAQNPSSTPPSEAPSAPAFVRRHPARRILFGCLAVLAVVGIGLGAYVLRGPFDEERPQMKPEASRNSLAVVHGLPERGSFSAPVPAFDTSQEYVLLLFGMQGLYLASPGGPAWNAPMPDRRFEAQLIRRGGNDDTPHRILEGVRLYWEVGPKTAFVETYAASGASPSHTGEMEVNDERACFTAVLPLSDMQADGVRNPYPVVTVSAVDAENGTTLATSSAVLGVSPPFACGNCHADSEAAILAIHDTRNKTDFMARNARKEAINCRSCHNGLTVQYGIAKAGTNLGFSAAIHGWHVQYLTGKDESACASCHVTLGTSAAKATGAAAESENGSGVQQKDAHPLFLRGLHFEKGLRCVNCHGYMEDHALSLLTAEAEAGQPRAAAKLKRVAPRSAKAMAGTPARVPWIQEPDCASCHDFIVKPKRATASAYGNWTLDEFELFAHRVDQVGTVRCAGCHGAPHALYPAANPLGDERDNLPPLQYQNLAAVMGGAGNCAVCHGMPKERSAHHPFVKGTGQAAEASAEANE